MPAHTPSPHRFLAPIPPSTQKSKPKPHSNLRHGVTVQTPKHTASTRETSELQFKKVTPAKRFVVAAPRHSNFTGTPGREKETVDEALPHTNTQLTPRPKPTRKFERVESIEELSQLSSAGTQDEPCVEGVVQSIEDEGTYGDDKREQEDEEMLFETMGQNKRRRISPPISPSYHPEIEPQTPAPPHNATTHRFKVLPPRTPAFRNPNTHASTTTAATTPAPHRPQFILPPQPTSPPKPSKPLPEIFSPSRKNGKYIPDGLASTVTGWIIETANTGFAAQERSLSGVVWGRDREDGVKLRVRIRYVLTGATPTDKQGDQEGKDGVDCFAGGVVFVRGDMEPGMHNSSRGQGVAGNDGETRVLLAGQGGARGTGGVKIRVGSIVGIRAPMWDVDVGGEKWVVGVDWVLLS